MVLINGRKFACEACIRGHRASSCAHTSRQLQLVRPKGRPSSQCDICRAKRAAGSFHGRCDCEGGSADAGNNDNIHAQSPEAKGNKLRKRQKTAMQVETFTPFNLFPTSTQTRSDSDSDNTYNVTAATMDNKASRHSLQALMNPCQCRTTGICSCCSRKAATTSSSAQNAINVPMATIDQPAKCGCNGTDTCCDDELDQQQLSSSTSKNGEASTSHCQKRAAPCCGSKKVQNFSTQSSADASSSSTTPPATPALLPQSSADFGPDEMTFMSPECQCGPTCSCPGCINDEGGDVEAKKKEENDDCPDKCLTCSACVLGLTRPSGIDAVDEWIERDRNKADPTSDSASTVQQSSDRERAEGRQTQRPRSESQDRGEGNAAQQAATFDMPAMPPTMQLQKFFRDHFLDQAKRNFFAEQLNAMQYGQQSVPHKHRRQQPLDSDFGDRLPGETDEQWKARHGFRFLTPETIKIFDHAKNFREERRKAEEVEERQAAIAAEGRTEMASLDEAAPSIDELARLRAKALAARDRRKSQPSTAT